MKRRIASLLAIHHYGNRNVPDEMSRTAASPLTAEQQAKMPLIAHPIVRTTLSQAARPSMRYRAAPTGSSACRTMTPCNFSTNLLRTPRRRNTSFALPTG
jgi:hypothetical protein